MKYKSIFISDTHLGTRGCQAELLCHFLKTNTSENLYIVGDFIDMWALKRSTYWPQSHTNVIRQILTASKRGTIVYYVLGNHDEDLRKFLHFDLNFGRIKISNREDHIGVDNNKYLVIHGDLFDAIIMHKTGKFWSWIGNHLYTALMRLNIVVNTIRSKFNLKYWSFASFCKRKTKRVIDFFNHFETAITIYSKDRGYSGVICGHIHSPSISFVNGAHYMNCGDWVDSCSAVVEHYDGTFEIIRWIEDFE